MSEREKEEKKTFVELTSSKQYTRALLTRLLTVVDACVCRRRSVGPEPLAATGLIYESVRSVSTKRARAFDDKPPSSSPQTLLSFTKTVLGRIQFPFKCKHTGSMAVWVLGFFLSSSPRVDRHFFKFSLMFWPTRPRFVVVLVISLLCLFLPSFNV